MVKGVFTDRTFLRIRSKGGKEMTEEIYHYSVSLPDNCNEAVRPCLDGYTVYTNNRLSRDGELRAYLHSIDKHILHEDLYSDECADQIEARAHGSERD